MSYLPYVFDFQWQQRMPMGCNMPFMSETLFEGIDPTAFEYFPKLSNISGVRKPSKDRFEVYLDVEDFGPDDIRVKTVDGFVVIKAQHKERRDDHGWVQRKFCRRCPLPDGYKTEALLSQYSSDGTLTITATLVKSDEAKKDKPVTKKEEDEENSNEEPDQPEPDEENQSEKKPVKSKPAKVVVALKEKETKPIYVIDDGVDIFLEEFKIKD